MWLLFFYESIFNAFRNLILNGKQNLRIIGSTLFSNRKDEFFKLMLENQKFFVVNVFIRSACPFSSVGLGFHLLKFSLCEILNCFEVLGMSQKWLLKSNGDVYKTITESIMLADSSQHHVRFCSNVNKQS